jgi:hypothetical protein
MFWRPKKPYLEVDMGCRTSYSFEMKVDRMYTHPMLLNFHSTL